MSHITEIRFRGYKALRSLDLALGRINALTGPNNAGKSTTLSALRLLDAALSYARRRRPVPLSTSRGRGLGYVVPTERLMVSIANVHTDLEEMDTEVTFFLEGGGAFHTTCTADMLMSCSRIQPILFIMR